jgi:hypothetical protein
MSAVVDARKLFGSLQLEARTRRFKTEVAALERQCSDFVDMFEAVAWARQHPASAMHFMLAMKDDARDQVLVGRLARILYGRRRAKTENRLTAEAPFPPPVERVEPAEPDSGFGSDIA